MDNRDKSNRQMMLASTPAESRTYAAAGTVELHPAASLHLDAGADFSSLARDARRTRTIVSSGRSYVDHVWPDARQWDLGAFAEARWRIRPRLTWRNGARVDLLQSQAGGADSPSLGGKTVAQQYVRFYGPGASEVDRLELGGAVTTLLQWSMLDSLSLHAGGGLTLRPAGVSERYFAFGPAPGGFLVGNPTLAAEKRVQAEAGLSYELARWLELRAVGHYSLVLDYILKTAIARQDVNGDGPQDVVMGFGNVTAQLAGADLVLALTPLSFLTIPVTVSYVRGWNISDGRDLPEVPPLRGTAALRFHRGQRYRIWGELGLRWAAEQVMIDPQFPETETPAHAVLDLRAGVGLWRRLWFTLGLENLLDTRYYEHLTREAVLATGDLQAGDKIPAPGRTVMLGLRGEI
jgi:iron complex outermembrane receptor protein